MERDFHQNIWDQRKEQDLQKLLEIAVWEDLGEEGDLTSQALIPPGIRGKAGVYVRKKGVIAGLHAVPTCLATIDPDLHWTSTCQDGEKVGAGTLLGHLEGPVLGMLMSERLLLNLLGHLCGIATLTREYVDRVAETKTRIYDTRKTTLGWRRLEKYAVRCGGGYNHRTGLFDAVLIKDNHLAFGANTFSPSEAVERARTYLSKNRKNESAPLPLIEIEVDSLDHFEEILAVKPDIVLLDNMAPDCLQRAVDVRNRLGSATELEASGGITFETVLAIAQTGVERISIGSLTHSNHSLDVGLDWESS